MTSKKRTPTPAVEVEYVNQLWLPPPSPVVVINTPLIGGPRDGMWIKIDPNNEFHYVDVTDADVKKNRKWIIYSAFLYRRRSLKLEKYSSGFVVWADDDLNDQELLRRIVAGYRGPGDEPWKDVKAVRPTGRKFDFE